MAPGSGDSISAYRGPMHFHAHFVRFVICGHTQSDYVFETTENGSCICEYRPYPTRDSPNEMNYVDGSCIQCRKDQVRRNKSLEPESPLKRSNAQRRKSGDVNSPGKAAELEWNKLSETRNKLKNSREVGEDNFWK